MKPPKLWRNELGNFVLRDVQGGERILGQDGQRAGEALRDARAVYANRYRVLILARRGQVTAAFSADPRRARAAHAGSWLVTCGPLESRWKARQRRARLLQVAGGAGFHDLAPHLRAAIRKESMPLSGPDVRRVNAQRRLDALPLL
jgi:hypothetical protein